MVYTLKLKGLILLIQFAAWCVLINWLVISGCLHNLHFYNTTTIGLFWWQHHCRHAGNKLDRTNRLVFLVWNNVVFGKSVTCQVTLRARKIQFSILPVILMDCLFNVFLLYRYTNLKYAVSVRCILLMPHLSVTPHSPIQLGKSKTTFTCCGLV